MLCPFLINDMAATPKLDLFFPETYDVYLLGVADITEYPQNWNIQNASLEITPPGFNKVNVVFTPKSVNYYKSNHLDITCDDLEECMPLPDGMYTVKYSIHPNLTYVVEKTFMRVEQLMCQFGETLLTIDLETDKGKPDRTKLHQVFLLIQGAVFAGRKGDGISATANYDKAKKILDGMSKNCAC